MIDAQGIRQLLDTYEKHGWVLRRVLLSDSSREHISFADADLFSTAEIRRAGFDAAWFSRPPQVGSIAWELRSLGGKPFALVQHVDENSTEFEDILAEVELRLQSAVAEKKRLDNGAS